MTTIDQFVSAILHALVEFAKVEPVAFSILTWSIVFMLWVSLQTIIVLILTRHRTVDRLADLVRENKEAKEPKQENKKNSQKEPK